MPNLHSAPAVDELFRLGDGFEERIQELAKALDSVEAIGQSAAETFEQLRAFQEQMAQLAHTFEPMRALCEQLEQLARTFEPMNALHQQMVRIADGLRTHPLQFAQSLQRFKVFRARVEGLAKVFEPVDELETRFAELAEAFRVVTNAGTAGEQPRT